MALGRHGPKLNRDWVGLRVMLMRDAENAYGRIAANTTGTITAYSPGRRAIEFQADGCGSCGFRPTICAMPRHAFEILTPVDEWPDTRGQGRRR